MGPCQFIDPMMKDITHDECGYGGRDCIYKRERKVTHTVKEESLEVNLARGRVEMYQELRRKSAIMWARYVQEAQQNLNEVLKNEDIVNGVSESTSEVVSDDEHVSDQ